MRYKGNLSGSEYGAIKQLSPTLSFECFLGNQALRAKVVATIEHPLNYIYRIAFSDDYVSDFYADDYGRWCDAANEPDFKMKNKQGFVPYVKAIEKDLSSLLSFECSKQYYCFRMLVDGAATNVFVHYNETDEGKFYRVCYQGHYHFSLVTSPKGWYVGSQTETPDGELARNVSLMIEAHEKDYAFMN
jgi:hypothetical protein